MNFVINKDQYLATKFAWKKKVGSTPSELVFYNLIRGFPLNRGFTPVTNAIKLANGASPMWAFELALHELKALLRPVTEADLSAWNAIAHENRAKNAALFYQKFALTTTPELEQAIYAILVGETK